MSWYKKSQYDNAVIKLMGLLRRVDLNPSIMIDNELMEFSDFSPIELTNAHNYAASQLPNPTEAQVNILWRIQQMYSGMQGTENAIDANDMSGAVGGTGMEENTEV